MIQDQGKKGSILRCTLFAAVMANRVSPAVNKEDNGFFVEKREFMIKDRRRMNAQHPMTELVSAGCLTGIQQMPAS
jgi:hypothetical protein